MASKNDGAVTSTYSYDWNDRLSSVDQGVTNIATYEYTDQRQRLSKTVGATTDYFISNNVEYSGTDYTNHLFANGNRVLTADVDGLHYSHKDHLQSTSLTTDSAGIVEEVVDYKAFGSERNRSGTHESDYSYTDQYSDGETGLLYMNSRYYDADLKRFTSVDPWAGELNDPQTQNKYSYVGNNPIKYNDPTGECYSGDSCEGLKDGVTDLPGQLADSAKFIGGALKDGLLAPFSSSAQQRNEQRSEQYVQGLADYAGEWVDYFDGTMSQGEREYFTMNQVPGGLATLLGGKIAKGPNTLPEYTLSNHMEKVRMPQRGITQADLENTLKQKPFEYFHDGATKNGYFDPNTRIFVGQVKENNVITTGMKNVKDNYINNLKSTIK